MSRILLVDDSPTETFSVKVMLEKAGFEVITASDAESGMKAVREQHPDLVLMDVVMPGLNGFQATRQLSRDPATAAIPIVMLTTKDQETDRVWGVRQGARGYLTKPVDGRKLLDTIRQVLAESRA